MHSDPEAIKKSVRTYFMIGAALFLFTVITVAVNQVHLAIPLAFSGVGCRAVALAGGWVGQERRAGRGGAAAGAPGAARARGAGLASRGPRSQRRVGGR